jgi:putative protease
MLRPEILAPAGDLEKLKTAFAYGADACYMGVKVMSMRVKENDMDRDDLEEALILKNKLGKKLYLTMNIYAHENKMNFLQREVEVMQELHKKGLDPDGVLIVDPGMLMTMKEKCPWIPLHLSTQANTLNAESVKFWASLGVERVVLARELTLREVKQIREKLDEEGIKVELESFVHGAMCMAYSGRCLLSNFMSNRDANEGMCSHVCRWDYKVKKTEYVVEEGERPGEYFPIVEDENGTSLMSSKDMCMVEHLQELLTAGIESWKIEGRHKTIYYLAIVTRAYKEALELALQGKPVTPEIIDLIESINTRGYFTGFWYGKPGQEGQKYESRGQYNDNYCFAGVITKVEGETVEMEVRNTLKKGDRIDFITPHATLPYVLEKFENAKTGEALEAAHPGQNFTIRLAVPPQVQGSLQAGFVSRKHLQGQPRECCQTCP